MVVPNVYSGKVDERESVLKALTFFGTLAGAGWGAALFMAPETFDARHGAYAVGILVSLLLNLAIALRLWVAEQWDFFHSVLCLVAAVLWMFLGFAWLSPTGAVEVILGGLLLGAGLGGLAGQKWLTNPGARWG